MAPDPTGDLSRIDVRTDPPIIVQSRDGRLVVRMSGAVDWQATESIADVLSWASTTCTGAELRFHGQSPSSPPKRLASDIEIPGDHRRRLEFATASAGLLSVSGGESIILVDLQRARLCELDRLVDPRFVVTSAWRSVCALWVTSGAWSALCCDGTYRTRLASRRPCLQAGAPEGVRHDQRETILSHASPR